MPDQIEVVKPNNDVIALFQREPVRTVTKAEQVQDLLGQDVLNISVMSVEPLDLSIGQRVTCFGKTYFLNQLPTAQVKGERHFEYDLTFEGPQYTLRKAVFFNADITGFNTSSDFPLTGDCELFLDVLINNLARVFGAGKWVKGQFPTATAKTITFSENNCLAALQTICKEFETEFDIVQGGSTHVLHIRKAGQILGHTYQYGRGYGLYELKRNTVTDSDIVTRLYPFGSNKNLKSNYRNFSQRLRIPDPGYIEDAQAIAAFGIIENTHVWDDIYPHRTGAVTAVAGVNKFVDSTMNFDLFEKGANGTKWILDGQSPKIKFNTGNLAGYEFSLLDKTGYVHGTKTFTLIPYEDERGLKLPNPDHVAFQIQVGDEYVILDIVLPDTYVETAELELLYKAEQYLDQVKNPKVQYALKVDELYLSELAGDGSIVNFYSIGDYLHILDNDLAIDKSSRIIGMRRDVLRPYKYELTIDDTYQVSTIIQIIDKIKDTDKIIKVNDLRDPNRARMGWKTTLELLAMIFDTDGYFDGGKIKPESIETMMLVVGAKSQQFILQDVIFQPNFEGNANVVDVSEGLLIHYALKEEILTWNIQASLHTIPDNAARYIYAKVSKAQFTDGNIIFSTEKIKVDDNATYYHFLIGTLHSVMEGVRWISLTYGATAINGRFIKTGRVQSFDGRTFFDLDLSAIGGYIKFIDSEGNYRDLSDIGAATDRFYELSVIKPLASYVKGKITAWFQPTNPATWPGGEESFHDGDMWFNSGSISVSRRLGGAWTAVSDPETLKSYIKQYTRLGNNKYIQLFTALPIPKYNDGDLWMSEDGLRRSVKDKSLAQSFDPNDWVEPFNFDNTATAIDGGIVTSGTIQLAGDKNAVWAGITGNGITNDSVRFWAGASYINRVTAPFRVKQSGEVIGRTRIEVEGVDGSEADGYKGQAGLAGSETENDTGVRIYAGSDYGGKDDAPFRVSGQGFAWMEKALIGNWTYNAQTGGMVNESGDAYIIARDGSLAVGFTEAMIGPNIFSAVLGGAFKGAALFAANQVGQGHSNIAARFEASGASPGAFGENGDNYAIYSDVGTTLIGEGLINGVRTYKRAINDGATVGVDPTLYDLIVINPSGGVAGIGFLPNHENTLRDGKTVKVVNINDAMSNFFLVGIIRGKQNFRVLGGMAVEITYCDGAWYVFSAYDNDY
ncbi:phage tail protein [Dyadobacter chenhuakuii]|uniref:Phage tail protein n=1 Tax=Dyadobacter chenhuakuii TaxID=2909339 RepID=A0A9X1QBI9_9BACT|nr:phage tail protein [Dyadobacter chenhuakuii]MCF2498410.1 phage tail protein [Dyadobacter chenhuakuii]